MARRKVTRGTPPRLAQSRGRTHAPARPAGKRSARAADDEADGTASFLSLYFRDMAELSVMSPEEELTAAVRIATLRCELWRALVSYPPFVEPILTLLESEIDSDEQPTAEIQRLRRTCRQLRDRETRKHRELYEAACAQLADKMQDLDRDGILADMIGADLNSIGAGQREGLSLAVIFPRQGSRPFKAYCERVRGTAAAQRMAKNHFVKANLRLVVSIARRFNHGRMPLQDLIQEGNIGLLKAVDRFDHRKGFRFSTYGSWWIRHAISRAVADKGRAIRLPVHMLDAYHKVSRARRELENRHGREPSKDELAEHTGLGLAKIERMETMMFEHAISLDRPVSDDDGRRVIDFLVDTDSEAPGEWIETESTQSEVRDVISLLLRPIEADILRKRFGLDEEDKEHTLKQIGEQYSLSRERIRQLQEQALCKIRRELKRREVV